MPSIIATCLREQIRFLKPILNKSSIFDARTAQNKVGELSAKMSSSKIDFEDVEFERFNTSWAIPKNVERYNDKVILYLHGGGYTAGHLDYAKGFGGILASRLNSRVFCVAYRLAPENCFPAALDDSLEAYRYLLALGIPNSDIHLAGESAGGGLIFCLAQKLMQLGLPMPQTLIALSPWTDLTMTSETCMEMESHDPSLSREMLEYFASLYAPDNLTDPLVSPIFGTFRDFPPTLIFVGSDEILLDDSRIISERLISMGNKCELHVVDGMWHVFVIFKTPESSEALCRIDEFIKENSK
ncbi:MAG: alpha/beta hydrolase [Oscillospiraceae bacterium]